MVKKYTEEQIIAVLREGGGRCQGCRSLPQVRDERRHLIRLKGKIRRAHVERAEKVESLGRGNPVFEADGGGAGPG
jgi:hypothetical protein